MSDFCFVLRVLLLSAAFSAATHVTAQDAPGEVNRTWTKWTLDGGVGLAVIGHGIDPLNRVIGMHAVRAKQFAYGGVRANLAVMRHLGPGVLLGAGVGYLHSSDELFNEGVPPGAAGAPEMPLHLRGLRGVGIVEVPFLRGNQVTTSGIFSLGVQKLGGALPGILDGNTLYGALALRVSVARKSGNMLYVELNVEQSTFRTDYRGVTLDNRIIGTSINVGYRFGRLMLKPS